jgi:uncharacterized protein (DUF2249 family)/iron-sulfur cluster repair protein YtfE (RIC family)
VTIIDTQTAGAAAPATATGVVVASTAADAAAVEAVKAHHAQLAGQLGLLVERLLTTATAGNDSFADARSRAAAFCVTELVPHARAEEESLYPAAARSREARLLVDSMLAEHRIITGLVDELSRAAEPLRATAAAHALKVLFESHLAKENDLLLPLVAADPAVSLAEILSGMHELLGGVPAHHHSGDAAGAGGCGCGGHDSEPVAAAPAKGSCGCGGHDDESVPELDVRAVPHAIRHATVFGAFDAIPAGGSILLVAPHDPLPLLRQLSGRCGGAMTVSYEERGPEAWRLLITRG